MVTGLVRLLLGLSPIRIYPDTWTLAMARLSLHGAGFPDNREAKLHSVAWIMVHPKLWKCSRVFKATRRFWVACIGFP